MSAFHGLPPILLGKSSHIQRAITVVCPVCHEQPGQVCKIENGKPVVHGARESVAYNGKRIWL